MKIRLICLGYLLLSHVQIAASELIDDLKKYYSEDHINQSAEALPSLEKFFAMDDVTNGIQALEKHWDQLDIKERNTWKIRIFSIFAHAEMLRLLGHDLPNHYHDILMSFPEGKKLYLPLEANYAVESETADANYWASSLSNFDHRRLSILGGIALTEIPEADRVILLTKITAATARLKARQQK